MDIAMIIFGILTVITACGVVVSKKSLNSALWLVATLFLVAVHFAIMGADFLAALQVLVYAGAIMVLVMFVIMLLGLKEDADADTSRASRVLSAVFCGAFVAVLLVSVSSKVVFPVSDKVINPAAPIGTPAEVGKALLTTYVYPFEITALLLLAAVIGAVLLSYEKKRPLTAGRGLRAVQNQNSAVDKN